MTINSFTLSSGNCTSITYSLLTSGGATIDTSVFTFSSSALTLSIYTTSTAKIGTYTFTLTGTLDSAISTNSTFSVIIQSQCYPQTITASTISTSNYNLAATTLTDTITPFTISTGTCTSATYTLLTSGGATIDTSVFTFSATALTLAVYSTDTTKIGTYSFTLTGTLDSAIYTTQTFSVIVHSQCYG